MEKREEEERKDDEDHAAVEAEAFGVKLKIFEAALKIFAQHPWMVFILGLAVLALIGFLGWVK